MKTQKSFARLLVLAVVVLSGAWLIQRATVQADYFDHASNTLSGNADCSSNFVCDEGRGGCDTHPCEDCCQADLTVTVRHNGAYYTDWIVDTAGATCTSAGVLDWWFGSQSSQTEAAFQFNKNSSPHNLAFHLQTNGGPEYFFLNLYHDDDDDDTHSSGDELFDFLHVKIDGGSCW